MIKNKNKNNMKRYAVSYETWLPWSGENFLFFLQSMEFKRKKKCDEILWNCNSFLLQWGYIFIISITYKLFKQKKQKLIPKFHKLYQSPNGSLLSSHWNIDNNFSVCLKKILVKFTVEKFVLFFKCQCSEVTTQKSSVVNIKCRK